MQLCALWFDEKSQSLQELQTYELVKHSSISASSNHHVVVYTCELGLNVCVLTLQGEKRCSKDNGLDPDLDMPRVDPLKPV